MLLSNFFGTTCASIFLAALSAAEQYMRLEFSIRSLKVLPCFKMSRVVMPETKDAKVSFVFCDSILAIVSDSRKVLVTTRWSSRTFSRHSCRLRAS